MVVPVITCLQRMRKWNTASRNGESKPRRQSHSDKAVSQKIQMKQNSDLASSRRVDLLVGHDLLILSIRTNEKRGSTAPYSLASCKPCPTIKKWLPSRIFMMIIWNAFSVDYEMPSISGVTLRTDGKFSLSWMQHAAYHSQTETGMEFML